MRKSISNLAWSDKNMDLKVAVLLLKYGFGGIDIAPTIYWKDVLKATTSEIMGVKKFWKDRGLKIIAVQSLLYGRPDLTVFNDADTRKRTLEYLKRIIILGAKLGARILVFGSPKSRLVNKISRKETYSIALDFFGNLGDFALKNKEIFCIEPNPKEYGCNFINTHNEAIELVKEIKSPGLAVNLDTSTIILNKEPLKETILRSFPFIGHMHVSEPYLSPIGTGGLDNKTVAKAVNISGYSDWVSFEMKKINKLDEFEKTIQIIRNYYERYSITI